MPVVEVKLYDLVCDAQTSQGCSTKAIGGPMRVEVPLTNGDLSLTAVLRRHGWVNSEASYAPVLTCPFCAKEKH